MTELPGFVGAVTFPEGGLPVRADLKVVAAGLLIRLRDGRQAELRFDDMTIEAAGLDGEEVLCRSRSEGYTLQCSAPGFLEALRARAHPAVADQLVAVERTVDAHRWRKRAGVAIAASLLVGCGLLFWYLPDILAASATSLPLAVDERLGETSMDELEGTLGPRMPDPVIQGFLDQALARLEPHATERGFRFRIHAVDGPMVNAFALPGGQMVVMRGLLAEAGDPEEVAGVLAHEMAHVTERHGIQGAAHGAGRWLALTILIGDDSAWLALAGEAAAYADGSAHSRDAEAEADAEGARLMAAAGLDPAAMARFFERLKHQPGGGRAAAPTWLSSHPDHDARIAHVTEVAGTVPTAPRRPLQVDWAAVQAAAR